MDILSAFIGGILAAGTGWFLQNRLESARIKKLKNVLLLGVNDDLKTSVVLYEQIAEGWERSKTIWFNLINELSDSRHIYTNNKEWIILIEDEELRNDISQYYRQSANHLLSLQNSQQRIYDIENKYLRELQDFKIRNPTIDADSAKEIVLSSMNNESSDLAHYQDQIPILVAGMNRFRDKANNILNRLNIEKV